MFLILNPNFFLLFTHYVLLVTHYYIGFLSKLVYKVYLAYFNG